MNTDIFGVFQQTLYYKLLKFSEFGIFYLYLLRILCYNETVIMSLYSYQKGNTDYEDCSYG